MFLEYRSHSTTVRYVCTLGFRDYSSVKRIVVEIHGRAIKTSSVTSQSRRRRPTWSDERLARLVFFSRPTTADKHSLLYTIIILCYSDPPTRSGGDFSVFHETPVHAIHWWYRGHEETKKKTTNSPTQYTLILYAHHSIIKPVQGVLTVDLPVATSPDIMKIINFYLFFFHIRLTGIWTTTGLYFIFKLNFFNFGQ